MCQAVTTVREPFSPEFPFLQRVRSVKGASLAMFKVDKPRETLQTCCEEECFVADAAVLRLPGILLLPGYQESRCRAMNFCNAGRKAFAIVQCLGKEFVKLSRSQQSTVLTKGHVCRCQPRTIVREPFSTVSIFAKGQIKEQFLLGNVENCGKLRKLEFGRHLRPWLERVLAADGVVLMLPGILSLPGITFPSIQLLPC